MTDQKILILCLFSGIIGLGEVNAQQVETVKNIDSKTSQKNVRFDDTRIIAWPEGFEVVSIESSLDHQFQNAYFLKSMASAPQPLIVSLHTWSGDYRQKDDLAKLCKKRGLNYIHPNFRGANNSTAACCSELALGDIDDAISYAITHANVDTSKIYVMGVSGGGYATLSTFMKSKHQIAKFSAWASISDLGSWYMENVIRKAKYASDIMACTGSIGNLDVVSANQRSPLFMRTPVQKLNNSKLSIYVGVYDGLQGSVSIAQSINFYNKIVADLKTKEASKYVSEHEKLFLLENRSPLGEFGKIASRTICLKKELKNLSLTIFEGEHEMLVEYALLDVLSK